MDEVDRLTREIEALRAAKAADDALVDALIAAFQRRHNALRKKALLDRCLAVITT